MMDEKHMEAGAEIQAAEYYNKALELIDAVLMLLASSKLPTEIGIDPVIANSPEFLGLYKQITDIRELASSLNQGDLQKFVYSRGYILSNLKALQSNLRHLTWQTQKIAEGDFSQRVDFLGDFSESFNSMTLKLKDSSQQLQRLASYDALTQVPNRLSLESFLSEAFERAKSGGYNMSILLFDIDHFKKVNDTYGHDVGDKVLIETAGVLSRQFRSTDIFARYGGEEFMAVLPGMNAESAHSIAQRALEAVTCASIDIGDGVQISVTVSVGVSELAAGDESHEAVIKRSDDALYMAKNSGRNRVCRIT